MNFVMLAEGSEPLATCLPTLHSCAKAKIDKCSNATSKNFLQKLHPYIKNKGEIYIVTDSDSYAKSILRTIHEIKILYVWKNQYKIYKSIKDYHELETKFYKKAIISGRKPSLFILKKI